ncbi:MAG: protein-disulfide isomerase [Bacteroidia bacterium]|jgi:protein-disulfide isomerase
MNKQLLLKIGRLILSFLFIFGAVSKLISMPFFDGMVAELLLGKNYFDNASGMLWIQWLTRILVAAELVLGFALLQNKWFKNLVLPATMGMLVLFTIHLFYEGFRQVNGFTEGNCGCFGDVLPMTNLESIIKNIIGMAIGIYVWLRHNKDNSFASWVAPTFLGVITLFTLSFGVKSYESTAATPVTEELGLAEIPLQNLPIDTAVNRIIEEEEKTTKPIVKPKETAPDVAKEVTPVVVRKTPSDKTLELLYTYAPAIESQNLAYGSKMVCLFSMTCSHCQEVYRDLTAMKTSGKLPNVYLVNYGTEYEQNYFFSQAGNVKSPHTRTEEFSDFKRMLEGKTYPRMLYVKDGKIVKEWDVDTYDKAGFMKYFGITELKEQESGGLQLKLKEGDSPW